MLIAIEGIDGSGKGTQAELLRQKFQDSGRRAELLSFPRYSQTRFGRSIGDFLNGRFGSLDQVSPFLASLLYAGDRFESRDLLQEAIASNDVVILDRYVASNIAHQGAKADGDQRRELIEWITQIEFDLYQLPRPDLTILLDVPPAVATRLILKKARRDYTDKPADLQEADAAYLTAVHAMYRQLARDESDWQVIDCTDGTGDVRPVEEIAEQIWELAQP